MGTIRSAGCLNQSGKSWRTAGEFVSEITIFSNTHYAATMLDQYEEPSAFEVRRIRLI
jgi:hypothetical protein